MNAPQSLRAIAAETFILMRADDLKGLGGYDRLRTAIIEDLRVAEMLKWNGRRIYLATTLDMLHTRMYRSAHELWEGLSRSAFEGTGFLIAKVLAAFVTGTFLAVLSWASALAFVLRNAWLGYSSIRGPTLLLALGACGMSSLVYGVFLIIFRVSPLYVFTLPLAVVFYSAVAVNSALATLVGRGVSWKARRHPRPEK